MEKKRVSASGLGEMALRCIGEFNAFSPRPDVLWHYTSSEGLIGILGGHSLRFSEAPYLNDGSELNYGFEMFSDLVRTFVENEDEILRGCVEQLIHSIDQTLEKLSAVVFCMCSEPNLLNQWRDYGKDIVPYCIGFDTDEITKSRNFSFNSYLVEIIYDRDIQNNIFNKLILLLHEWYKNLPELDASDTEQRLAEVAAQVSTLILRFKNPAFAAEREWRLISHIPEIRSRSERKFRSSSLGVVPYYELRKATNPRQLPVTAVFVGPSPYGKISHKALRDFLDVNGYVAAMSNYSTIPIR